MPPIVFVVRASLRDGLGHLVRSLAVLRELASMGSAHLLLRGDGSGLHLVDMAGVPYERCASDADAAAVVQRLRPHVVVFDALVFEDDAFDAVAATVRMTVSLSPVFTQLRKVTHLFLRTKTGHPGWEKEPTFPVVHKGFEYAVLPSWLKRVSHSFYREHLEEERLAVAISMGGTDAPNRTLALLNALGQMRSQVVLFVALGDAYTHSYEELLDCASRNRQEIILLKSNESMWRVLRNVSLVVCAGGLTAYEAAFIGLPTISLLQNAEWAFLNDELVEHGVCINLLPCDRSYEVVAERVAALEQDRSQLLRMHEAASELIPENGARRIAEKLLAFAGAC